MQNRTVKIKIQGGGICGPEILSSIVQHLATSQLTSAVIFDFTRRLASEKLSGSSRIYLELSQRSILWARAISPLPLHPTEII